MVLTGYAANLGIGHSTKRKNRMLRAPDLNLPVAGRFFPLNDGL
jgi:hypothetical protein